MAIVIADVDAGRSLYPADLQTINTILQDALRVFDESFVLTNMTEIDSSVSTDSVPLAKLCKSH